MVVRDGVGLDASGVAAIGLVLRLAGDQRRRIGARGQAVDVLQVEVEHAVVHAQYFARLVARLAIGVGRRPTVGIFHPFATVVTGVDNRARTVGGPRAGLRVDRKVVYERLTPDADVADGHSLAGRAGRDRRWGRWRSGLRRIDHQQAGDHGQQTKERSVPSHTALFRDGGAALMSGLLSWPWGVWSA